MASLEEILAERSQMSLAVPQLPVPPKTKLQEKKERLFGEVPEASPQSLPAENDVSGYMSLLNGGSSSRTPDLGNRVKSSLYSAGGSLADMGKSISNYTLGTEFDDSVETGWSRPANPETRTASAADEMANISFDQRQNVNEDLQGVMDTYVNDGLLSALWEAVPQATGLIADSGASVLELGAGALATPFAGSGVALLAKKAKNTFDVINKIGDAYDKAKEANRAVKAADKVIKATAKGSAGASLLTADIVQQTKVEYEQETGEKMSPERLAGTTMLTLATTAFTPAMVPRFYLPRSKGFVGKTIKEKYDNEMKQMVKYLDQGTLKAVANRVGAGVGKVFQAGGAEAVQEYAQTWAGILSVKMSPEEAGGLIASAFKEFGDADNQTEAAVAGILGSVAGGGIRAASAVPTTAVGAAADVAVSTGNKITRASYNAARDRLSPEDQEADIQERENIRKAAEEVRTEAARKVGVVSEAKGFEDISDESVRADLSAIAKGRDLTDPEVFNAVRNRAVRSYKSDSEIALAKEKTQNLYISGRKAVKKIGEDFANIANLTEEEIQAVKDYTAEKVESIKGFGKDFVKDIKNLETSASVGVAEAAVDFIAESTKKATKRGVEYANSKESVQKLKTRLNNIPNSVDVARSMADSLESKSPENSQNAVRELRRWADQKEKDLKKVGLKKDTFLNFGSLGDSIKGASQKGSNVVNPRALSLELQEAAKGSIENLETLQAVENALENYKQTDFNKNGKGDLSPTYLKNLGRKLSEERARLEKEGDNTIPAKTKRAAEKVSEKVGEAAEFAKPVTDWIKEKSIDTVDKLVDVVTNEDVFISEDTDKQRKVISNIQKVVKNVIESKEGSTDKDVDPEKLLQSKMATLLEGDTVSEDGKKKNGVFGEAAIELLSKGFKTSNPDYLMSIMGRIFPPVRDPSVEKILRKRISEVLKDSKQPYTEPTRQRKKSSDKTGTDTQNETDVVVEEEGAVFRAAPDLSIVNAKMEEILGKHICKV